MSLTVEFERESDGRWIAEIVDMPGVSGVMVYGDTRDAALAAVKSLAFRVMADRIEHGELPDADVNNVTFVVR